MRGTHPISIAFPAADAAMSFTDPSVATWNSGDTVASTLDNGKVQCSTCHDVHDQESIAGTRLLRTAQTTSSRRRGLGHVPDVPCEIVLSSPRHMSGVLKGTPCSPFYFHFGYTNGCVNSLTSIAKVDRE